MKILIIGSKGFIGTHTTQYFRDSGHDTYGCDVVVEYNDSRYFQVDATNASYEEMFSLHEFEACINCSGAASVPDSFVHPWRDFHLNVQNVYTILEAIRKHNPTCKFLNLSSAAVYGNPEALPVSESLDIKPLSPYGWHKRYTELVCDEFYTFFNIPTCSIRIFSAFGPGLKKQLFWDWFQKISVNDHITLFGTGRESRDFIYIDDLVQAIVCVVEGADFRANIINVGNAKEIFIKDAIEVFRKAHPKNFTYSFNNQVRKGDPLNWRADTSQLEAIGYKQQVKFEDGVNRYIQWLHAEK